jgi:hypothetical protein
MTLADEILKIFEAASPSLRRRHLRAPLACPLLGLPPPTNKVEVDGIALNRA